jgi:hypothetical protein
MKYSLTFDINVLIFIFILMHNKLYFYFRSFLLIFGKGITYDVAEFIYDFVLLWEVPSAWNHTDLFHRSVWYHGDG